MIKKTGVALLLFILLSIFFSLNFILSFENNEAFYPESAMSCNLDEVTGYLEEYLAGCLKKERSVSSCNDPLNQNEDRPDFYFAEVHYEKDDSMECDYILKQMFNCNLDIHSGPSYVMNIVGSEMSKRTVQSGEYLPLTDGPCFRLKIEMGTQDDFLCLEEAKALVESCEDERHELQNGHIIKYEREKRYWTAESVNQGYIWSNSAPDSAKINGLRKRAEAPFMSFEKKYNWETNQLEQPELSEITKFQVSMTYYLKAKSGAYGLAKNYYDFKEFSGENTLYFPPFLNNMGFYKFEEQDSSVCVSFNPNFKGICWGASNVVNLFYKNTYTRGVNANCDTLDWLFSDVANAVNVPGTRIDAPALRDLSYTCFSKMNAYASLIQKAQGSPSIIQVGKEPDFFPVCLGETYNDYLTIMNALSKGYPLAYQFEVWAAYRRQVITLFAAHATLALEPTSSGDLLIYDPNFKGGSDGKIKLEYDFEPLCELGFKYPIPGILDPLNYRGSAIAETIHPFLGNLFYIHQQNCKQAGICPNYNDYYLLDINGQNSVHISEIGLDGALLLSDDYFVKWLEYQYADNYLA